MLTEYKSYQLNQIQVHHYCGNCEVTFPKFGASYEEIEDLKYVDTLVSKNDQQELGLTELHNCGCQPA